METRPDWVALLLSAPLPRTTSHAYVCNLLFIADVSVVTLFIRFVGSVTKKPREWARSLGGNLPSAQMSRKAGGLVQLWLPRAERSLARKCAWQNASMYKAIPPSPAVHNILEEVKYN